ncbi:selenide, water dikinase SelD, partial [candidate division GN15 bacterium]|nr:selenide, water dikinase SelD [candidate division GN15 bacterium]
KELKYGVSVTGLIDPNRIVTNSGARPDDVLFLTRRLGTGLITTGIKREKVDDRVAQAAIEEMARLNRKASELMIAHGAHAATDITGYGLMGHALEMAAGSEVTLHLISSALPQLPEVLPLAAAGMIPGGANANREFVEGKWSAESSVDPNLIHLMFDPQTSGGLLIAIPEAKAEAFAAELQANDLPHTPIGRVTAAEDFPLIVE